MQINHKSNVLIWYERCMVHSPQTVRSDVGVIFTGVFIARGKEDVLVTKNLVPGEVVYGEKKIVVEVGRVLNECQIWFVRGLQTLEHGQSITDPHGAVIWPLIIRYRTRQ